VKLAKIASEIEGQPMFKILSQVQKLEREGKNIIHFELGEPDFNTPKNIIDSCVKALTDGNTHYAPSSGLHEFKVSVQNTTEISRKFKPDLNQILVTPGANSIIYLALKCLIDEGDEVLVPNPGFPTYFSAIKACGGIPVSIPLLEELSFAFRPEDIIKKITKKTKAIILNSPSNPTGGIINKNMIKQAYEVACENNLLLISDEIYSRMMFDDNDFFSPSMYDHCKENTLIFNGFSKAFAMTGWRLGVAIGPEKIIEKMALLTSTIVSCVPPFIQLAGVEAIEGPQKEVNKMLKEYENRAKILVQGLNEIKGIYCTMPKGAIYVFANIKGTGLSSEEFCKSALDYCNVAITPGNFFGSYGEGYVRFSIVSGVNNIHNALKHLKDYFNY